MALAQEQGELIARQLLPMGMHVDKLETLPMNFDQVEAGHAATCCVLHCMSAFLVFIVTSCVLFWMQAALGDYFQTCSGQVRESLEGLGVSGEIAISDSETGDAAGGNALAQPVLPPDALAGHEIASDGHEIFESYTETGAAQPSLLATTTEELNLGKPKHTASTFDHVPDNNQCCEGRKRDAPWADDEDPLVRISKRRWVPQRFVQWEGQRKVDDVVEDAPSQQGSEVDRVDDVVEDAPSQQGSEVDRVDDVVEDAPSQQGCEVGDGVNDLVEDAPSQQGSEVGDCVDDVVEDAPSQQGSEVGDCVVDMAHQGSKIGERETPSVDPPQTELQQGQAALPPHPVAPGQSVPCHGSLGCAFGAEDSVRSKNRALTCTNCNSCSNVNIGLLVPLYDCGWLWCVKYT